jgi:prolyl-tRNA synthetase
VDARTVSELAAAVTANKFARVYWSGDPVGEERIKQETGATVRCIPLDQPGAEGQCITSAVTTTQQAIFARAY